MLLTNDKLKELRIRSKSLKPVIRIGKNGLTGSQLKEIGKMLQKKKLIKIKMLKSFLEGKDKKEEAKEIAAKLGAELIDSVGFVATVYKN